MKTGKHNKNFRDTWDLLNRYISEGMSFSDAMIQAKKDLNLV
jgi:hypothetical protein